MDIIYNMIGPFDEMLEMSFDENGLFYQESGNSHPKYDGKLTHVAVNDANDYVKVEDFETDESINGIIEPQECFSMENDIKIQVDFPTRNDRSSEYCTSWSDRCKFLLCNI